VPVNLCDHVATRVMVTAVHMLLKTLCSRCPVAQLQYWWAAAAVVS